MDLPLVQRNFDSLTDILLKSAVFNFKDVCFEESASMDIPASTFSRILSKSIELNWMIPTDNLKALLNLRTNIEMDTEAVLKYTGHFGDKNFDISKISMLTKTRTIEMLRNDICNSNFEEIAANPSIKTVLIKEPMSVMIDSHMPKLNNVQVLEISSSRSAEINLDIFDSTFWSRFQNLKKLSIKNFTAGLSIFDNIKTLENLTHLSLERGKIINLRFSQLVALVRNLKNLRVLTLNDVCTEDISCEKIAMMVSKSNSLDILNICCSNIDGIFTGDVPVRKLKSLRLMVNDLQLNQIRSAHNIANEVINNHDLSSLLIEEKYFTKSDNIKRLITSDILRCFPHGLANNEDLIRKLQNFLLLSMESYLGSNDFDLRDLLIRFLKSRLYTPDFLENMAKCLCSAYIHFEQPYQYSKLQYLYEILETPELKKYIQNVIESKTPFLAIKFSDIRSPVKTVVKKLNKKEKKKIPGDRSHCFKLCF